MFCIEYGENDQAMWPLLYCVGHAFPAREASQIDYHVDGLLQLGAACGDPDWQLERYVDHRGQVMYRASSSTEWSGLEPSCGDYEESVVKATFLSALQEYLRRHPECLDEIQGLIGKFRLAAI